MAALAVCAERMQRRGVSRVRAVATQACRVAAQRAAVRRGGRATHRHRSSSVISPREEARLAVAGCAGLLDPTARAALVLDVGGGSTEISWLDLDGGQRAPPPPGSRPRVAAWLSLPIGVVTLAERFPEPDRGDADANDHRPFRHAWSRPRERRWPPSPAPRPARRRSPPAPAHIVGTSGAITSLAGLHLGLPRYERRRVDGLWMSREDCEAVTRRLMAPDGRRARGRALHRAGPRRPGARRRRPAGGGAGGLAVRAGAGRRPRPARGAADEPGGRRAARRAAARRGASPPRRAHERAASARHGSPAGGRRRRRPGRDAARAAPRAHSPPRRLGLNDRSTIRSPPRRGRGDTARAPRSSSRRSTTSTGCCAGARVIDLGCAPGGWLQVARGARGRAPRRRRPSGHRAARRRRNRAGRLPGGRRRASDLLTASWAMRQT